MSFCGVVEYNKKENKGVIRNYFFGMEEVLQDKELTNIKNELELQGIITESTLEEVACKDKFLIETEDEGNGDEEEGVKVKKKPGRKPKDKKNSYYFSDREENAVVEFIGNIAMISGKTIELIEKTFNRKIDEVETLCEGRSLYDILEIADNMTIEDKNRAFQVSILKNEIKEIQNENDKIYNQVLKPVFKKMIESIMRRYHRYIPNEETGVTFNDTLTFLLTKMHKFNKDRNTKAYSYYGNMCKNYLLGKYILFQKEQTRNPSYDDENYEFNLTNNIEYSVKTNHVARTAFEIVEMLKKRIATMIESPERYDLKESEVVLGKALINLLENWDYVITSKGSPKLNKSACLFFLREQTKMDTKTIRENMKKYKNEFLLVKNMVIS